MTVPTIVGVVGVPPKHVVDGESFARHLIASTRRDMDTAGMMTPTLAVILPDGKMHCFIVAPFVTGTDEFNKLPAFVCMMTTKLGGVGAAVAYDAATLADKPSRRSQLVALAHWRGAEPVTFARDYIRGGQLIVWDPVKQGEDAVELLVEIKEKGGDPAKT